MGELKTKRQEAMEQRHALFESQGIKDAERAKKLEFQDQSELVFKKIDDHAYETLAPLIRRAFRFHDKDGTRTMDAGESKIFFSNYVKLLRPPFSPPSALVRSRRRRHGGSRRNPRTPSCGASTISRSWRRRSWTRPRP